MSTAALWSPFSSEGVGWDPFFAKDGVEHIQTAKKDIDRSPPYVFTRRNFGFRMLSF